MTEILDIMAKDLRKILYLCSPMGESEMLPPMGWGVPDHFALLWGTLASAVLQRLVAGGPWRPLKE